MEHNDIRDTMKNPLLDIDEDISTQPGQDLRFFEKIGLISALVISFAVLMFSIFSFFIDAFVKQLIFLLLLICSLF